MRSAGEKGNSAKKQKLRKVG